MYRNTREVFQGLLKNATEGLAAARSIGPFTLLLLLGQVAPLALILYLWTAGASRLLFLGAVLAATASYLPRIVSVFRFQQPLVAAVLHPVAILVLLSIQWVAFVRMIFHVPATWKGRAYVSSGSEPEGLETAG
jgi:hypothetical protein